MRIRNRKLLFASAAAMLLCMLSAALILHINVFAEVQTQTFRPIVALVNFADSETPFTEENRGEFETIFNSTEGGTDEHNLQSYLRTLSRGKIDYQSQFVVITLDRETNFYQNWNGSGLENIFKILRIDYYRRLTYLNHPNIKKGGIRVALRFTF